MNETNPSYQKLVAKIQVYMSNKTINSNYFHHFEIRDRKNMLNFMTIVYFVRRSFYPLQTG